MATGSQNHTGNHLKPKRRIGAHLAAGAGLHTAAQRVFEMGGNCLQIFSGSPRIWRRKDIQDLHFSEFFKTREKLDVKPIFTHSLYLINLASDKSELVQKSIQALKYDLEFDSAIKGSGIIVHLGSHQGRGWDAVKVQVKDAIHEILSTTPASSTFLIEPSAGQNGKLCSDLSELKWLLDELQSTFGARIGWCLDTCHSFAAGYYLGKIIPQNQVAQKNDVEPKNLFSEMTQLSLIESLRCIHVNDSRDPYGSGRDRHHNLGDGEIGLADFKHFLANEKLKDIPLILEVPGLDKNGPDAENMRRLISIL
ncbi:MAG: deoxyribonuclease IV [Microgenomates group bacterium]